MIHYAIGDIHGMLDQLKQLVGGLELYHKTNHPNEDHRFVFLGDYVDRGPNSRGVLEYLMSRKNDDDVILPGNHEQMMYMMVDNIDDGSFQELMQWWARNGGWATMESYFPDDHPSRNSFNWLSKQFCVDMSLEWQESFPEHKQFLLDCLIGKFSPTRTAYYIDYEDKIMFCHAGIMPKKPLSEHNLQEILWSRHNEFLVQDVEWVEESVDMVVHGHTPMKPDQLEMKNRTGLDTGVFSSGRLTGGVFVDGQRETLLFAEGSPANFIPPRFN